MLFYSILRERKREREREREKERERIFAIFRFIRDSDAARIDRVVAQKIASDMRQWPIDNIYLNVSHRRLLSRGECD